MNEITYMAYDPELMPWEYMQELASHCDIKDMKLITEEKIYNNKLGVIALDGDKIIGYIAQTALHNDATAEIGSLIVQPSHRRRGVASELIRICTSRIVSSGIEAIIAFCNTDSARIFNQRGYKLTLLCKLTEDSSLACGGCPKKVDLDDYTCCARAYMFAD